MSSSLQASNGGTVEVKDVSFALSFPSTRQGAYDQLKAFLCNSNLSAQSTSQYVYSAVSYIASHCKVFTDQEAFTVIDLALANGSTLAKDKEKFLSLSRQATFSFGRYSSGLALNQNLKVLATHQGTYLRLLDLLSDSRFPKSFISDVFNAMRSIASQSMTFTNEQYCKIADCALANEVFSGRQKEYFQMWKQYRSRTRMTSDDVDHIPTYATILSSSGSYRLCEDLQDPVSHQGAYLRLTEMLSSLRSWDTSRSELFNAVRTVASRPEFFCDEQFLMLKDRALNSELFTEAQQKIIRAWREGGSRITMQVASGISESRDAKPKDQASDAWRRSCSQSPLFLQLRDRTTCQEAYKTVLGLVREPGLLSSFKPETFDALIVIGSRRDVFTKKQFFTVARYAMLSDKFSDRQKKKISEMMNTRRGKGRVEGGHTSLPAEGEGKSTTIKENDFDTGVSYRPSPQDVKLDSPGNPSSEFDRNTRHGKGRVDGGKTSLPSEGEGKSTTIKENDFDTGVTYRLSPQDVKLESPRNASSEFDRSTRLGKGRVDGEGKSTTIKENNCDIGVSYRLYPQEVQFDSPRNASSEYDRNTGNLHVSMEVPVRVQQNAGITSAVDRDILGLWWNPVAIVCSLCGGRKSRRSFVKGQDQFGSSH